MLKAVVYDKILGHLLPKEPEDGSAKTLEWILSCDGRFERRPPMRRYCNVGGRCCTARQSQRRSVHGAASSCSEEEDSRTGGDSDFDAVPTAATRDHHDLATFVAHAARSGLAPTTTVYVGTHYEYSVAGAMGRHGFSLTRTGGASDLGIDLVGAWRLPCFARPVRVLVQCKAVGDGPRPRNVRELEGAFAGAPARWRGAGVLGVLATTNGATKGVRDALTRSAYPLGYLMVTSAGAVVQLLWNSRASSAGLDGLGVALKHRPDAAPAGASPGAAAERPEIALTWEGQPVKVAQAG